jgi:hypothetical protein
LTLETISRYYRGRTTRNTPQTALGIALWLPTDWLRGVSVRLEAPLRLLLASAATAKARRIKYLAFTNE